MEDFLVIKSGGYIAKSEVVRLYESRDGWHCELRDGSTAIVYAPTFGTLVPNHNACLVSVTLWMGEEETTVCEAPILAWLIDGDCLSAWIDASGSSVGVCFGHRAILDKQTGRCFVPDDSEWDTLDDFKQHALDEHLRQADMKAKAAAKSTSEDEL